jgi:hypothetical protein
LHKVVAGLPNPRPAWYFDVTDQGEGLADTGVHLVDRVHETLFPEQALDWQRDIDVFAASRWPTSVSLAQFRELTGEGAWPAEISDLRLRPMPDPASASSRGGWTEAASYRSVSGCWSECREGLGASAARPKVSRNLVYWISGNTTNARCANTDCGTSRGAIHDRCGSND